ncbi:hypothetical protein CEXT_550781 [Caerostris extrusa]|uniref:Uncharacterized protein n=1 Tax=Caerostris extrusa TaxID=172846 RepID=A0AAV4TXR8_CAEEX|nr:hypothetical protein CEXT_550781 [Caerostris extrusa]
MSPMSAPGLFWCTDSAHPFDWSSISPTRETPTERRKSNFSLLFSFLLPPYPRSIWKVFNAAEIEFKGFLYEYIRGRVCRKESPLTVVNMSLRKKTGICALFMCVCKKEGVVGTLSWGDLFVG